MSNKVFRVAVFCAKDDEKKVQKRFGPWLLQLKTLLGEDNYYSSIVGRRPGVSIQEVMTRVLAAPLVVVFASNLMLNDPEIEQWALPRMKGAKEGLIIVPINDLWFDEGYHQNLTFPADASASDRDINIFLKKELDKIMNVDLTGLQAQLRDDEQQRLRDLEAKASRLAVAEFKKEWARIEYVVENNQVSRRLISSPYYYQYSYKIANSEINLPGKGNTHLAEELETEYAINQDDALSLLTGTAGMIVAELRKYPQILISLHFPFAQSGYSYKEAYLHIRPNI